MKNALYYLSVEIVLSLLISLFLNKGFTYDYLTTFGLINLVTGAIGLLIAAIIALSKKPDIARAVLISSAFLLLIGFVTCSAFPIRFNGA
jgi:hypothetical protein